MKIIYNKFLIVSTIFLLLGGVYLYFSNNLNSGEIVNVAYGSSLSSSAAADTTTPAPSLREKISSDIAFLSTLTSLNTIKIDTSIFSNQSFVMLRNNEVKIGTVTAGRINPFAPIEINNINNEIAGPKIITDQPTVLTDKTVVLNGNVNILNGVTDAYFEYGVTPNLGLTTPIVKPSLVGAFIKNVLGLTPKTNYFYRACAKINNIASCGEVVSFNTN